MSKADRQSGNGFIDAATLAELERLARSRPRSGRQAQAKASALRMLERLARDGRRRRLPPCPPDWHPMPGTAWEELDRHDLEAHPEVRQRMWEQWHRPGERTPGRFRWEGSRREVAARAASASRPKR
jgi:hypothetical protein